jgi:hypothetical protein
MICQYFFNVTYILVIIDSFKCKLYWPRLLVNGGSIKDYQNQHCLQKYTMQCCQILQAFTASATPSKNHGHLGTFHGHQIFLSLPQCHIHSHISGFLSCPFYSFSTQIVLLLAFLLLRLCLLLLVSLAGSWRSCWILAVVNIPAVACFPAVAGVS